MDKKTTSAMGRMLAYAGGYRVLTILGCVLAAASTVLSMLPFVFVWALVRSLLEGQATSAGTYAWMALIAAAGSIVLYYLALNCTHLAAFRTATNMKKTALRHLNRLPLGYFVQNPSGRVRKVIDDNTGLTEGFLAHQLPDLAGAAVMPVALLVCLVFFDWRLGVLCLVPMILAAWFLRQLMGGENAEFMSKYMTALETMNQEAVEYIRGIPVVKVFQQTVYSFTHFSQAIEHYKEFATAYAVRCRLPMTGFTVALGSMFVLLVPAALLLADSAADGQRLFLDFLFYILFAPTITTMMNRIMFAGDNLMVAREAMARLDEILEQQPLPEPESPAEPSGHAIRFARVSFTYPGSEVRALDDVSFSIPQGASVALVGRSGGGKSTIGALAARFYDVQEGAVEIGGVDVRRIGTERLMENVSLVLQRTRLFKATLLDNVRAARPEASPEDVEAALTAAQCGDIVARLPRGLDTVIGSENAHLSGGEQQRIGLARAILKDAPIIILDEATAFADIENEQKIHRALGELTAGKTVLTIAHRLSTVADADRILVMEEGRLREEGTHDELLAQNGIYAHLWQEYRQAAGWKLAGEEG